MTSDEGLNEKGSPMKMPASRFWLSLAVCLLAMTALGDTNSPLPRLFSDLVQRYATGDTNVHNPLEGTEGPKVLTTGDLNRDGLADLVAGNLDGSISVLLGSRDGTLGGQILIPATGVLSNS